MAIVNEKRTSATALPRDTTATQAGGVQMRSRLRGAALDAQMSLLEPAEAPTSAEHLGAAATGRDAVQRTAAAQSEAAEPVVTVDADVVVSETMIATLEGILRDANLRSATITSGARSSWEQAEAMYANVVAKGVASQLALYAAPGDQVIRVYQTERRAGRTAAQIKAAMRDKIVELGPSNVSKHCSDTHDTIDVAAGSIANKAAFKAALNRALAAGEISKFIPPGGGEPAFHIEKPK